MKKQFKIVAVTGFAHPACLIVSGASKFRSTISLKYKGVSVNLKNSSNSIMELMSLRIKPGTYIEITANGCDEQAALKTIENSLSVNLYIEPGKQGNSWTVSKELCPSCDEVVFETKHHGYCDFFVSPYVSPPANWNRENPKYEYFILDDKRAISST